MRFRTIAELVADRPGHGACYPLGRVGLLASDQHAHADGGGRESIEEIRRCVVAFRRWLVLLAGMTLVPVACAFGMGNWLLMALTIFLLGATAALVIPLQMRLTDVAGDAQTLAAALNHAAVTLANALGRFFAGFAPSAGFGWASAGSVGAGLAAAGIVIPARALAGARRRDRFAGRSAYATGA